MQRHLQEGLVVLYARSCSGGGGGGGGGGGRRRRKRWWCAGCAQVAPLNEWR